jgi:putative SOS response-associated peptidase YedK
MCGRFSLSKRELVEVAAFLDAELEAQAAAGWRPRYNVAPSDVCFIARERDGRRTLEPAVWGLQAGGDGEPDRLLINARSETVGEKRAFQESFRRRRCVVPADGFFEWTGEKGRRRPIWFHRADGGIVLFAGVWEPRSDGRPAFTILTTAANARVAPVHDRMPVLLSPSCVAEWLAQPRADLLVPAPEDALVATPVSPRLNAVENDDPGVLEPPAPEPPEKQLKLF